LIREPSAVCSVASTRHRPDTRQFIAKCERTAKFSAFFPQQLHARRTASEILIRRWRGIPPAPLVQVEKLTGTAAAA